MENTECVSDLSLWEMLPQDATSSPQVGTREALTHPKPASPIRKRLQPTHSQGQAQTKLLRR